MGFTSHCSQIFLWLLLLVPPITVGLLARAVRRYLASESSSYDPHEFRCVITRLTYSGVVVLLLFLVSLCKSEPFSTGQRLGLGLLLGGLAAAVAAIFDGCSRPWRERTGDLIPGFTSFGLLVLTYSGIVATFTSLGLLLSGQDPLYMFLGMGTGVLIMAFTQLIPQKMIHPSREINASILFEESFYELFIAYALTTFGAMVLTVLHYDNGLNMVFAWHDRYWIWQLPLWLSTVPFGITLFWGLIGAWFPKLSSAQRSVGIAVLAFLDLLIKYPLLSKMLYHHSDATKAVTVGAWWSVLLLALLLRFAPGKRVRPELRWLGGLETATLVPFVLLIGMLISFKAGAGYGVAMAALAMTVMFWCAIPWLADHCKGEKSLPSLLHYFTAILSLALCFALLRAFQNIVGMEKVVLDHPYVLFSILLGCLLPFLLDSVRIVASLVSTEMRTTSGLLSSFLIGFGAVVTAPMLFLFWRNNAVAGLFLGLLVGQTMLLFLEMVSESEVILHRHTYRLIAWGIMFSALRLVPLLEPYGSFATQQHKIVTIFLLAMIFFLWSLISARLTRKSEDLTPDT